MSAPSMLEYILRLALSVLFGSVIGLEREFRMKDAGIRTHLIVSLASCLMMLVSKYGFYDVLSHPSINLDPSRIAAGIVTAIGFLGAGTILSRGRNVTGLTTAAGLWATVGIGMAAGAGMYLISIFGTAFIVGIQALLHWNFPFLSHLGAVVSIRLCDESGALEQLNATLSQMNLPRYRSRYERADGVISVTLEIDHLPVPSGEVGRLFLPLMQAPYIKSIQW